MSSSPAPRRAAKAVLTPLRLVALGFAAAIAVGTVLLLLPAATQVGKSTDLLGALFTATSAMCLTGLIVVDTPTHWSGAGQGVILALIQIGGFGIMTMASLVGLVLADRIGLRGRLNAAAELRTSGLGDVRSVVVGVVRTSLLIETAVAACLAGRFAVGYDEPLGRAVWLGIFHSVSAFNNAGFALFSDNMISFATDPWICVPLLVAVVLGGIGFPVLFEVARHVRGRTRRRWTLHTRLTVTVTAVLLVLGPALVLVLEWSNTLSERGVGGKLLVAAFQGIMPRTAGFNSIDYADADNATLLVTDVLMFIGGGSGGTAGGIKVTTFAILLFVIIAEVRGDRSVTVFDRRIDSRVQRQSLTVALVGVALVMVPVVVLLAATPFDLDVLLFEVVSAFATVGLSTGITAQLPGWGQLILVVLMYLGRIGSITLVSALAARERDRRYTLPTERPFIG
ncbi:TrkH family potassium uptake protein [Rhodococcus sp. BP-149]|uniref:TrkH family potassium uptake protein n=1 Tax=unclassified Rhodococcus (in: high G+C Gram-positive bacteria) TaxID=192944 RepID=UPI001C9B0988|nr:MULTISPECIES: potassium transporter TrkG [unclassified Rhodococcus (in: high G+C Gram-positive bacteria)]MBY6687169.1 TrkH family potassium uptake protein [Rhodococcus sp. BP-288]MBY6694408.1 TrkH family potassium uptake protein [Rhodococcus sp. BP-188]MBY6698117.1 TrkH family potassium uptake protein [Rhodococcus sp. BP-285]MBY6704337.1 TrkH family potassium uptake protein [Rhodococcus sp. BP-283]MBY6712986.1 TrkH family potassium uptake protein [Rhodococcus sp. BP-160]